MPVDPARRVALAVLEAVSQSDAYANLLLASRLRAAGLAGRDAAFTTELVAGTLRRRGSYDAVLAACVDRPVERLDPAVLDVLRLGVHQLLGMRVPAHAAVATTVSLTRSEIGPRPVGLVNAVLRRVAQRSWEEWVTALSPDPHHDLIGHLALAHAHPRWVVEALAEALARPDELPSVLAADNEPPAVTLVARPGLSTRAELLATAAADPTAYSALGVRLRGGDPAAVPALTQGRAGVQDEGSQLVALALLAAPVRGRDERWLDLCAGPGGKAALLAAAAAQRGARLLAVERQPARAALVRRAVTAVPPGTALVVAADGTRPVAEAGGFDRVLVDAPCTGLGALRRRPEARWRRRPDQLAGLAALQGELLRAALALARPGGVVLYATCSPVLAETADVVAAVVADGTGQLEDAAPLLPGVPDCGGPLPGTAQLWPHRHGTDAMFLALLRRPQA